MHRGASDSLFWLQESGACLGVHSILALIRDSSVRERVCGEIARAIRCPIYAASDVQGALGLLQKEQPTILIVTSEFAHILGKPVVEVVKKFSPETVVLFLPPTTLAAVPMAQT
jgi:hypothetical protein